MEENTKNRFINWEIFGKWYFKKGLILVDIFIIIALIQYFVFDGSLNALILWVREYF